MTPAKAVERFRLEAARRAVEHTDTSLEQIAESSGFGDAGRMRRAFLRLCGLPPQALRRASPPPASLTLRRKARTLPTRKAQTTR